MNYCLSITSFFLLFLSLLLSNDAQARVFPGLSLNNGLIILNIGGRMSNLPPPSSTISSPQLVMEITRSASSSIFEMSFDGIGWITSNVPTQKAASATEQQQAELIISNKNHETSNPLDKLITIPSTSSNLVSPPRGPWPPPVIPKVYKSTPPARPSSPTPAGPIIHKPMSTPPIIPSSTSLHAPHPAIPPKRKVHPPPIMPSSTSLHAPNPHIPPRRKVHPPPIMPSSTSLHAPNPEIPPIQKVHPPPIMPSSTSLHAPKPAIPPIQISVPTPPIRPSSKSNDQMIDRISTPSNDSVISMIKHPQNDYHQAS